MTTSKSSGKKAAKPSRSKHLGKKKEGKKAGKKKRPRSIAPGLFAMMASAR